ncbi:glycerate kinase [Amycolatopsis sp. CA-230715]|uniref:glycerate kinase n=1 Tax=Amycolatopsis sp. CA-230715 TaxID=2745196 RepID=UPI001C015C0D|nr:glycerate kinase [Amycolatopsis sp. CA-230715]QWF76763.1 Glycerate 2-kinase [Amycolatopsis sp. CA-230715]
MPSHVRVVIAPDKFKGTLPADGVAAAVAAGLRRTRDDGLEIAECPIADGGDGTVAAAVAAGYRFVPVTATGPTGKPVETGFARDERTAVVELASVSGLSLLPGGELEPLTANTIGVGELIKAALDEGCRRIVLGVGGSAGTDGGAGLVRALGAGLLDADGAELAPGGAALLSLARLDLGGFDPRVREAEFVIASDVDNPLLGPHGAAAVYGPQKGADDNQVGLLDDAMRRWSGVVESALGERFADAPGAGAAGGTGFAALALLGARFRPGIDVVMELTRFAELLPGADLVITGEGSLDEQTLHGKGPAGIAAAAAARGIPVVAVAGRSALSRQMLRENGFSAAYALTDVEPDVARCMSATAEVLEELAVRVGEDWL